MLSWFLCHITEWKLNHSYSGSCPEVKAFTYRGHEGTSAQIQIFFWYWPKREKTTVPKRNSDPHSNWLKVTSDICLSRLCERLNRLKLIVGPPHAALPNCRPLWGVFVSLCLSLQTHCKLLQLLSAPSSVPTAAFRCPSGLSCEVQLLLFLFFFSCCRFTCWHKQSYFCSAEKRKPSDSSVDLDTKHSSLSLASAVIPQPLAVFRQ